MKQIDTSHITLTAGYPPSKKGLDFLQEQAKETIANLVQSQINGTVSSTTPYVLWGCVKSGASSPYAYTAGAIYFNGEVYDFDAVASLAVATADICSITTTADPTADPTTMTDTSVVNMHDVRKITVADGTAGTTDFDWDDLVFLQDAWHKVGSTTDPIAPAFQNSWANYGGAYFDMEFRREPQGFVSLRGRITGGTTGTVVTTLPLG